LKGDYECLELRSKNVLSSLDLELYYTIELDPDRMCLMSTRKEPTTLTQSTLAARGPPSHEFCRKSP
jgi:hypothetical protein